MALISVTRLKVRAARHLPAFALHTYRSIQQLRRTAGFRVAGLLADGATIFWTMTAWDDEGSMRAYMLDGAHRLAMPYLLDWCDEASLVHWEDPAGHLPTWRLAHERLCAEGRASKVRYPSSHHADLDFRPPLTFAAISIRSAAGRSP